jgi:hypothetical protein
MPVNVQRMKAGNPIFIQILETLTTFNKAFKECFGDAFIL